MKIVSNIRWLMPLLVVALASMASGQTNPESPRYTETLDKFEAVRTFIQTWLAKAEYETAIISPAQLKETVVDRWDSQQRKYQIISVRKPDDYKNAGHIPHAVNVYWPEIVADSSLAKFATGQTLILYCYYGHASMICWTVLSLVGYHCQSLDFGMMNWNIGALVKPPWDREADYAVDTIGHEPQESYRPPALPSVRTDLGTIIEERAREYFASEGSPVIASTSVDSIVTDWESKKGEYQIVDVRSGADYRRGHVPDAMNIPLSTIAEADHLTKLDPARTVIVYSENGQTGEIAATVLNLLGYRAVNMKFGMMDWNKSFVNSTKLWDSAAGYPVEN